MANLFLQCSVVTAKLPAYANTISGDHHSGGLNSPKANADFAEQCGEIGYRGFKMHGWINGSQEQESEMIRTVAERVENRMDIMYDSACHLKTLTVLFV